MSSPLPVVDSIRRHDHQDVTQKDEFPVCRRMSICMRQVRSCSDLETDALRSKRQMHDSVRAPDQLDVCSRGRFSDHLH